MTLKRALFAFAVAAVVLNVAGGVYAYLTSETMHGLVHGALAVGFGLWARHLWISPEPRERYVEQPDKIQMLEADMSELERELRETRERLDFADQLLNKKPPSA